MTHFYLDGLNCVRVLFAEITTTCHNERGAGGANSINDGFGPLKCPIIAVSLMHYTAAPPELSAAIIKL